MRYLWLSAALLLFALSLLTVFKAPTLLGWKLALLGDEFGYGLFILAVLLAAGQMRGPTSSAKNLAVERITFFVSVGAAILLAGPPLRAWNLSRTISDKLSHGFGTTPSTARFFRWTDFLRIHAGPTAEKKTYLYSDRDHASLHLDFYPPARMDQRTGPSPCVLVIHGGGWNNGDRTQLPALNSWLAERGYAVAAIDYRLVPQAKWPAPREDAEAALAWLLAHAEELNIDPRRLVLLGRSAGGQIALATAYGNTKQAWRGVISLYGPADLAFAYQFGTEDDVLHSLALLRNLLGGTPEQASAHYQDASPYFRAQSDVPPTLLMHGGFDTLVWNKQSERLDKVLTEAGAPHAFISLPWATHAFDINLNGPSGQLTKNTIAAFLKIVVGDTQTPRQSASANHP